MESLILYFVGGFVLGLCLLTFIIIVDIVVSKIQDIRYQRSKKNFRGILY